MKTLLDILLVLFCIFATIGATISCIQMVKHAIKDNCSEKENVDYDEDGHFYDEEINHLVNDYLKKQESSKYFNS